MARLKKSSRLSTEAKTRGDAEGTEWKDTFSLVEPQINGEGVHRWKFDVSCAVDVLFMITDDRERVRMNRHDYFEILYLCSGSGVCRVEDRLLPFNEGDLAVIGSTVRHRVECRSSAPLTIAALFFEPESVWLGPGNDGAEYLTPFLVQDEGFPHVLPARTGIPRQVLDIMLRIQEESPASTPVARLAVKTHLKMILMLLVKHYAAYARTVETFRRQERARERLQPLFRFLGENWGTAVAVGQAAQLCGMSESRFMTFFKQATGRSFAAYFNHLRIERAKVILSTTEESLFSISRQLGFSDQSYFCTVFRKIAGMSPATYRRSLRPEPGNADSRRRPNRHLEIRSTSTRAAQVRAG